MGASDRKENESRQAAKPPKDGLLVQPPEEASGADPRAPRSPRGASDRRVALTRQPFSTWRLGGFSPSAPTS